MPKYLVDLRKIDYRRSIKLTLYIIFEVFHPYLNVPPNNYIGIDLSYKNIQLAKKRFAGEQIEYHVMNFNKLDSTLLKPVQVVISSNVLHWAEDVR